MPHHSIVGTYDDAEEITLDGQMVLMLFRNPHAFVQIDVPDENGAKQRWAIEWGGAARLSTRGITRDTFKPGDHVDHHGESLAHAWGAQSKDAYPPSA